LLAGLTAHDVAHPGRLIEEPDLLRPAFPELVERADNLIERKPVDRSLDAALLRERCPGVDRIESIAALLLEQPLDALVGLVIEAGNANSVLEQIDAAFEGIDSLV
jgi:hypothetical protein